MDHFNPVDGDEVPVPHFGAALSVENFQKLSERLKSKGVKVCLISDALPHTPAHS